MYMPVMFVAILAFIWKRMAQKGKRSGKRRAAKVAENGTRAKASVHGAPALTTTPQNTPHACNVVKKCYVPGLVRRHVHRVKMQIKGCERHEAALNHNVFGPYFKEPEVFSDLRFTGSLFQRWGAKKLQKIQPWSYLALVLGTQVAT